MLIGDEWGTGRAARRLVLVFGVDGKTAGHENCDCAIRGCKKQDECFHPLGSLRKVTHIEGAMFDLVTVFLKAQQKCGIIIYQCSATQQA